MTTRHHLAGPPGVRATCPPIVRQPAGLHEPARRRPGHDGCGAAAPAEMRRRRLRRPSLRPPAAGVSLRMRWVDLQRTGRVALRWRASSWPSHARLRRACALSARSAERTHALNLHQLRESRDMPRCPAAFLSPPRFRPTIAPWLQMLAADAAAILFVDYVKKTPRFRTRTGGEGALALPVSGNEIHAETAHSRVARGWRKQLQAPSRHPYVCVRGGAPSTRDARGRRHCRSCSQTIS